MNVNWDAFGAFITDKGFSVFVAVYLLVRGDQLMRSQITALRDLRTFLEAHLTK